jgi:hypothetical protein
MDPHTYHDTDNEWMCIDCVEAIQKVLQEQKSVDTCEGYMSE